MELAELKEAILKLVREFSIKYYGIALECGDTLNNPKIDDIVNWLSVSRDDKFQRAVDELIAEGKVIKRSENGYLMPPGFRYDTLEAVK